MKIRIEIFDDLGSKTAMEFEGKLCKERLIERFIDFIETNAFKVQESDEKTQVPRHRRTEIEEFTIKERMEFFLKFDYPRIWFTSLDVKREYERVYGVKLNLSTVSTYLARMYRDEIVERRGNRTQREYKIIESKEVPPIHPEESSRAYFFADR
ncbi:MAG: hypothetical protein SVY15_05325 [Halobacteriota archaeon]|nr:hypothetical protein [Halobacteriota archaeon]